MRFAIVESGIVTNVVEADANFSASGAIQSDQAAIGDSYVDGAFSRVTTTSSPIILVCTAYQLRQALTRLGFRASVEAAVMAGSLDVQDAWQYAAEFREDHPKILEIATAIGKTPGDIKTIFALAVTLFP
ncbi:MAG: hypothetical protein CTY18_05930 [Methylomonas sp.]|nr:MAG: hypothetical protein CTY18_05930 [Methylomonas sp.]